MGHSPPVAPSQTCNSIRRSAPFPWDRWQLSPKHGVRRPHFPHGVPAGWPTKDTVDCQNCGFPMGREKLGGMRLGLEIQVVFSGVVSPIPAKIYAERGEGPDTKRGVAGSRQSENGPIRATSAVTNCCGKPVGGWSASVGINGSLVGVGADVHRE